MTLPELIELFEHHGRRYHLIGDDQTGVVVGLDLEGRLFAGLEGKVLHRVNPDAFSGISTRKAYLNPGGDGLWPAPEGSTLGYEYASGQWRVPPGLTAARYIVQNATAETAIVCAEIDLVNNSGMGIPVLFERRIGIQTRSGCLAMEVTECIEYLGTRTLDRSEATIAPWTLCQFDTEAGCQARFPDAGRTAVWDLYDPSDAQRVLENGIWVTRTEGGPRYQLGLAPQVEWIEFINPQRSLTVRRTASAPSEGHSYIDIADRPPQDPPDGPPVRFSVYSDPEFFMEIEAAGGCPQTLTPGSRLCFTVNTAYQLS